MQYNNKNNQIIANELEIIALQLSKIDSGNTLESLAQINKELTRVDCIAKENNADHLRALSHWMLLNTEFNKNIEDQLNVLLSENYFLNWIEILASLLQEYDQALLALLHQSLTSPDWPVKPSSPLLKNIAGWIEETKVEFEDSPTETTDKTSLINDFTSEVDDIVMSLAGISATSNNIFADTDKYITELQRLEILAEISSFSAILNVCEWCQRNLKLFSSNHTEIIKLFIEKGECWMWIEHVNACLADPEEISTLSSLTSELNRDEWLEPLDADALQNLLLFLRDPHGSETKNEDDKTNLIIDLEIIEAATDGKQENEIHQTSGLQLSWNDDIHPELLTVYLEETPQQISKLTSLIKKLSLAETSKEEQQTAARMAHTIKGGSALVGITALSELTYKLETILDYSINNELPEETINLLLKSSDCLENLFDAVLSLQDEPVEFAPLLIKLTNYTETLDDEDVSLELSTPKLPDFITGKKEESKDKNIVEEKDIEEPALNEVNIKDVDSESVPLSKPDNINGTNDFNIEVDDIAMTLASLSAMAGEDFSNLDEYSNELQRLELLAEMSGYPQVSSLSQWCQKNLVHFAENQSELSRQFIVSGESWTWIELLNVCVSEPEELSYLALLSTELIRDEWQEPLPDEDLQSLLLSLRESEKKVEDTSAKNSPTEERHEEPESIETASNKNENNEDNQFPSNKVISWDEDIHPEILAAYFQETPDQITEVASLLDKVSKGKANKKDLQLASRIAHTIKGSSGVIGINSLVELTHKLEDILDYSVNNTLPNKTAKFLSEASDCLESLFESIQNKENIPEELPVILEQLTQHSDSLIQNDSTHDASDIETEQTDTTSSEDSDSPNKHSDEILDEPESMHGYDASKKSLPVKETHIRVPVTVIDKLLNLAGELVTTSTQVSDQLKKTLATNKLVKAQDKRVHKMLNELSNTISKQEKDQENMLSSLQDSDFDSLEMDSYNELHSVAGLLTESILDSEEIEKSINKQLNGLSEHLRSLGKLNKELSDVILSSRMVSINTLVPRLERIVRQTCRKTKKKAKLTVTGDDINIDTDILNGLVDPLLHLLRNAVDHGIEPAKVRKKRKKAIEGKIHLAFTRVGNNILMTLKDDGTGIDSEIIYQSAIEKNLITPDAEFSKSEILKLILQPGFSTQDKVNDISGRGVGMDVVNSAVEALKGNLSIDSDTGKGTTFEIKIPLTLVTSTTLLVTASDNPVAIPIDFIDQLFYLSPDDVFIRTDGHYIKHEKEELLIQSLSNLLDWPTTTIDFTKSHTLLLIKSEGKTHAVHIEEIIYSREVVIKNLTPWVNTLKGVIGACHLTDGAVAPVINLPQVLNLALAKSKNNKQPKVKPTTIENTIKKTSQILVVDDSLSNRKALSLIIDQTAYDVITAVDGLDALQVMNDNEIDLVFTDLEMPRMNGLELTQAIRAWDNKKQTPIVMITSRTTSKHRELAEKAGVDDYLTKPVITETLLDSIEKWLKQTEIA